MEYFIIAAWDKNDSEAIMTKAKTRVKTQTKQQKKSIISEHIRLV